MKKKIWVLFGLALFLICPTAKSQWLYSGAQYRSFTNSFTVTNVSTRPWVFAGAVGNTDVSTSSVYRFTLVTQKGAQTNLLVRYNCTNSLSFFIGSDELAGLWIRPGDYLELQNEFARITNWVVLFLGEQE